MLSFIFKLFKFIFFTFVVIFGLIMAIGLVAVIWGGEGYVEETLPNEEYSEYIPVADTVPLEDSILTGYMKHYRVWRSYDQQVYEGGYVVSDSNLRNSYRHRADILKEHIFGSPYDLYYKRNQALWESDRNLFHWTWVYETILNHNKTQIPGLISLFDSIYAQRNPDRLQFAEIIVSHVQYIPYSLIHDLSCAEYIADDPECNGFRCQYHRDGNPCVAGVEHGVFSPVEFAYNLKGDCDTRVLLLMVILDHYGYDVKMLYSYEYGHAVLGIDLLTSGSYVISKGVKYYVWETTNTGWLPGQIEPQYQNMDYWVAMDTQF
ncbi:MAG: hypothetical protein SF052_18430 [Bacteroidia bacterium]|nr:hypothetical protein [Bacteroidia bacterium]